MKSFEVKIDCLVGSLNRKRRFASNGASLITGAGILGAVYWGFNMKDTGDDWAALVAIGIAVAIVYLLRSCLNWFFEFFFTKKLFEISLEYYTEGKPIGEMSPSLRSALFARYGAFRAIALVVTNQPAITWILIAVCVMGFYLIVPPLALALGLFWRYGRAEAHGELENRLLREARATDPIKALLKVRDDQELNEFILNIIDPDRMHDVA